MTNTPVKNKRPNAPFSKQKVPVYLIKEMIDGVPFYYKNYQQVLTGSKHLEDIMGSSSLQSFVISFIFRQLVKFLDEKQYHLLVSEPGLHIDRHNNLSGDILIYERNRLTPEKINTNYTTIPALVAIEVDVKVDVSRPADYDYVIRKTQKLLDFGTSKVIWVFTESQKVMTAEPNTAWLTHNWNQTLEIIEGVTFNIAEYLFQEGIKISPKSL